MSAGLRRNLGLLLGCLGGRPSPAVLLSNGGLALRALGPLALPVLALAVLQAVCSWDLAARGVQVVAGLGVPDAGGAGVLVALCWPPLFAGALLSTAILSFTAFFCTLLETSPPADLSVLGLTRFLGPVYLAALAPSAVSYVLDAPLLVSVAVAGLPLLLLSWPHLPEVLQLVVLFVRAKVNSRGRTRDMLDAIMGRIRPSRLVPLLVECVLQMGLLNFVTRQGLDALLLHPERGRPSLLLAWVAWPSLYLLVYACTRTFVSNLSQLSGGICLVLLGVRYEWLRRTLESYPGPLLGRLGFVLRVAVTHCREHFALTRTVCKHLPAAAIFLFFRLTNLSPPFKCASALILAVFGFYQWMGLLRFPIFIEETSGGLRERTQAEDDSSGRIVTSESVPQRLPVDPNESTAFRESESSPAAIIGPVENTHESDTDAPPISVSTPQEDRENFSEQPVATVEMSNSRGSLLDRINSENRAAAVIVETEEEDSTDSGQEGNFESVLETEWPNGLRTRRNGSLMEPSLGSATNAASRRERGLMDSVNSLIANSANIPRSLNRVHEDPQTR